MPKSKTTFGPPKIKVLHYSGQKCFKSYVDLVKTNDNKSGKFPENDVHMVGVNREEIPTTSVPESVSENLPKRYLIFS